MKKEHAVIVLLSSIILIMVASWIITSQPKAKAWVNVGVWNYNSWSDVTTSARNFNFTTEQFIIEGEEWRFHWGCQEMSPVGSHFTIKIFNAYTDNSIKEIQTSSNQDDDIWTGEGESYLNVKGRFYAEIFINGKLGGWFVSIQEYK